MSLFEKEAKKQIQLFFSHVKITVEDLITGRVRREITKYNHKALAKEKLLIANHPLGASQPTDLVHTIQDSEKRVSLALQAFEQNQFILLVDLLRRYQAGGELKARGADPERYGSHFHQATTPNWTLS